MEDKYFAAASACGSLYHVLTRHAAAEDAVLAGQERGLSIHGSLDLGKLELGTQYRAPAAGRSLLTTDARSAKCSAG
jgi:hypothetical protein